MSAASPMVSERIFQGSQLPDAMAFDSWAEGRIAENLGGAESVDDRHSHHWGIACSDRVVHSFPRAAARGPPGEPDSPDTVSFIRTLPEVESFRVARWPSSDESDS